MFWFKRKKQSEPNAFIVAGLGNPGTGYEGTRHNVGYEVVELVGRRTGARQFRQKRDYKYTITRIDGREVILIKPTTFMNLSGLAIEQVFQDYGNKVGNLLVVVDDLALPRGAIRIRPSGSDGGHNGLKSITEVIGTTQFARIRVGIGQPADKQDAADYVLERYSEAESKIIAEAIDKAADAVIFAATHPLEEVMSQFNHNPAQREDI